MNGVKYGFMIVNSEGYKPAEQNNYTSATCAANKHYVEQQIKTELEEGRYIIVEEKPLIISALGAIVKDSGKVRLIHDASQPQHTSLNSYATIYDKISLDTINHAEELIRPGYFLAKIDLKSAYRSVLIHPSQYKLTGLKWCFDKSPTYMVDTRLPFGARLSVDIFYKLGCAVKYIMSSKGYHNVLVYLDDFLIIEPTKEKCIETLNILIKLVRKLGFSVAWDKVEGPTNRLTFLGVELDTTHMELRLPSDKCIKLLEQLDKFADRKRVNLRQCQELAGKLNWATRVVRIGSIYQRHLFEAIKLLRANHHKIKITEGMRTDIMWWKVTLNNFNGVRILHPEEPLHYVDVSSSHFAAGINYDTNWYCLNWQYDAPDIRSECIMVKEAAAIACAIILWGTLWKDGTVIIHTRHKTAIDMVMKGRVNSPYVLSLIHTSLFLAALLNVNIKIHKVSHEDLKATDCIANLNIPGNLFALESFFGWVHPSLLQVAHWALLAHMSMTTFLSIYPQVATWLSVKRNWKSRPGNQPRGKAALCKDHSK